MQGTWDRKRKRDRGIRESVDEGERRGEGETLVFSHSNIYDNVKEHYKRHVLNLQHLLINMWDATRFITRTVSG